MFAYITLLTTDSYYFGVLSLKLSLDKTNTQYPLIVLYTDEVNNQYIENLKLIGCICKKQEIVIDAKDSRWHQTFIKFEIYKLIEYDKLCFLDADMLVIKNLDYLFESTEEYIYEVYRGMPWSINTSLMVIKPNITFYNKLINFTINFISMVDIQQLNTKFNEEEILSFFYLNNSEYHFIYFSPSIIEHINKDDRPYPTDKSIYHYMSLKKPWGIFINHFWKFYFDFIMDNFDFFEKYYFTV